jgi:hypothetical protein
MSEKNEFEKLNERKQDYLIVDNDEAIFDIKNCYPFENRGESVLFIKDTVIIGDGDIC